MLEVTFIGFITNLRALGRCTIEQTDYFCEKTHIRRMVREF